MKPISLILRIVAIVAAIAAVVLYFMTENKLEEKQTALNEANRVITSTQNELDDANATVSSLQTSLKEERDNLANTKRQLESSKSEMYTAKQEVSRTKQQLTSVQDELEAQKDSNRSLRAELQSAETRIAAASSRQEEVARLKERVAELETANADLKEEMSSTTRRQQASRPAANTPAEEETEAGLFRPTYPVSSGTTLKPAAIGPDITIASISAKDGLIVFEADPSLGLSSGNEFKLIRDLKSLGQVRVSKVTPDYILANILPGSNTRALAAGNTVKILR